MSSRHTRSFFGVMLAVVFALSAVVVAPASAKLTKHQKAHVRKQLKRAIKKNPKLIRSKHFIKRASLVNFVLPVTIRLRNADPSNPLSSVANQNRATIDLGASLGRREIDLGGTLPAEIKFHDSFDGGALGNVDLALRPGGALTSTSIPLLWNKQVSQTLPSATHWFAGGTAAAGCSDFLGGGDLINSSGSQHGVPYFADGAHAQAYIASVLAGSPDNSQFVGGGADPANIPEMPGVDSIDKLTASKTPGNPNALGGQLQPFPSANDPIGGTPSVKDTVLRTGPLSLKVATPGPQTAPSVDGDGATGTDTIDVGPSGGEANLFGNIPGKSDGIDVTVSLETEIASIIREVDADNPVLVAGAPWPGAAFQCRQAWTGYVHNVLAGIHLGGSLKISPAILSDGKLRIAKATLQQSNPTNAATPAPTRIALAACLAPFSTFAKEVAGNLTVSATNLPVDETLQQGAPTAGTKCNSGADALVHGAHFNTIGAPGVNYSTTSDGSQVSVAGDLTVNKIDADVIIGDAGSYTP